MSARKSGHWTERRQWVGEKIFHGAGADQAQKPVIACSWVYCFQIGRKLSYEKSTCDNTKGKTTP